MQLVHYQPPSPAAMQRRQQLMPAHYPHHSLTATSSTPVSVGALAAEWDNAADQILRQGVHTQLQQARQLQYNTVAPTPTPSWFHIDADSLYDVDDELQPDEHYIHIDAGHRVSPLWSNEVPDGLVSATVPFYARTPVEPASHVPDWLEQPHQRGQRLLTVAEDEAMQQQYNAVDSALVSANGFHAWQHHRPSSIVDRSRDPRLFRHAPAQAYASPLPNGMQQHSQQLTGTSPLAAAVSHLSLSPAQSSPFKQIPTQHAAAPFAAQQAPLAWQDRKLPLPQTNADEGHDSDTTDPTPSVSHEPFDTKHIYMLINTSTRKSKVGQVYAIAYYDGVRDTVYFGEVVLKQLEQLKYLLTPAMILLPMKEQDDLWQQLKRNDMSTSNPFKLQSIKKSEFSSTQSMQTIHRLHVADLMSVNEKLSPERTLLALRSVLPMDNHMVVSCVGTLLMQLVRMGQLKWGQPKHASIVTANAGTVLRPIDTSSDTTANTSSQAMPLHQQAQQQQQQQQNGMLGDNASDDDSDPLLYVSTLQPIDTALTSTLYVDRATQAALHIFDTTTAKPINLRAGVVHTERPNIYAFFRCTRTVRGTALLRHWLEHPSRDLDVINERLQTTGYLLEPEHRDFVPILRKLLTGVKDMTYVINSFVARTYRRNEWVAVDQLCHTAVEVANACMEMAHATIQQSQHQLEPPSVPAIILDCAQLLTPPKAQPTAESPIYQLISALDSCFDLSNKTQKGRRGDKQMTIREGVDAEYDHLLDVQSKMPKFLYQLLVDDQQASHDSNQLSSPATSQDTSNRTRATLPDTWQQRNDLSYLFLPSIGYVLKVPAPHKYDDQLLATQYRIQYAVQDRAGCKYYKTATCYVLDSEVGDIQQQLKYIENRIGTQMAEIVLSAGDEILRVAGRLYELEVHLALAQIASSNSLTPPTVLSAADTQQPSFIQIAGGWHPVYAQMLLTHAKQQQQSGLDFQPNDTSIGGTAETSAGVTMSPRIHILTGLNSGGKSVYLSQVGLIVYLAHCGFYVPAQQCTLTLHDAIYTKCEPPSDAMAGISTYTADVTALSYILRHATSSSLLLIDEFGKGTSSHDGPALLASVIEHFNCMQHQSPLVVTATHMHEIFTYKLVKPTPNISLWQMQCVIVPDAREPVTDEKQQANGLSHDTSSEVDQNIDSNESTAEKRSKHSQSRCSSRASTSSIATTCSTVSTLTVTSTKGSSYVPTVVPLYKVIPGCSQSSYAFACAERSGLPANVVRRARELEHRMRYQEAIMAKPAPTATLSSALSTRAAQSYILESLSHYAHTVQQLKRRPADQLSEQSADQALVKLMKAIREYP